MGWLSRWRSRLRFYGNCPACGHDWREHPPHWDHTECGECRYEFDHEQRETSVPACRAVAPPAPQKDG